MATIRDLSKKISSLLLDTDLITMGKGILKWVVVPILTVILLSIGYEAYDEARGLKYCRDEGVSESKCDYFLKYGD
ncbi:MAG: hypothetical protein VX894_01145 [Pseudomonadota bacterium]|nr:hypothetical protein [Pseudomonadota bacterium]